MATILRDKGWTAPWSSLVALQPGGQKPTVFAPRGDRILGESDGSVFAIQLSKDMSTNNPQHKHQIVFQKGWRAKKSAREKVGARKELAREKSWRADEKVGIRESQDVKPETGPRRKGV